jgi:hypothetical protein
MRPRVSTFTVLSIFVTLVVLMLVTAPIQSPVGNVAQTNAYAARALAAHGVLFGGMGGAGISGYSAPFWQAWWGRTVLINDAREHHYCLTIRLGSRWKHYDYGIEDPNLYDYPYSEAFLRERSAASHAAMEKFQASHAADRFRLRP